MTISIIVPSRGRPGNMARLVETGRATAVREPEFVFYLDEDDPASWEAAESLAVGCLIGPRIVLSEMWNEAAKQATGDILMHCGDDIAFRTDAWDTAVEAAFEQWPDRIGLVYGRDGVHDERLSTHAFLSREWVETLGRLVPPYFSSDMNDLWNWEVAGAVGRRQYLPQVYTEHMHPAVGKGELDATHQERMARGARDGVEELYRTLAPERDRDAQWLREAIGRAAAG